MSRRDAWPWKLPVVSDPEIFAAKALSEGTADDHQQLLVWHLIRKLAGADKMTFWPGGEDGRRATDFNEGKRWVADQLRRLARLTPSKSDPRGEPPAMPTAKPEG